MIANLTAKYQETGSIKTVLGEVRETMKVFAMTAFSEKMKDFFEKYPTLKTVSWLVYTPWCDGDLSEVCSYHEDCRVNNIAVEDDREWAYDDDEEEAEEMTPELEAAATEVRAFMKEFSSEDMEMMFGAEIRVVVSRTGVETENYDADY